MKSGWTRTTVSDVAVVQSGSGFPKKHQGNANGGIPFYKVSDMSLPGNEREMVFANNTVSEDVRAHLGASVFPPGSTIFPKIGGAIATNKKRQTTRVSCVDNNVMGVVPKAERVLGDFLFYFFLAHDLSEFANEAHLPSIRKTVVEGWPLDLPDSLAEQQQIVGILDEAFEGIATAEANAEKNLRNARAAFDSRLHFVFAQHGEGWEQKRLEEVCEIVMGQSPDGSSYNSDGRGTPLVNGPVEFSPDAFGPTLRTKFTTQPTKLCREGDLILCVRGSTTGRMNIAAFDACIGRGVAAIRAKQHQPWVNHFINSARGEIYLLGTGATFPNVSGAMLGQLRLSVPSLSEQMRISDQLDSLRAETQRLESVYQRKLATLEELKRSLLHQAFTGQLGKQAT